MSRPCQKHPFSRNKIQALFFNLEFLLDLGTAHLKPLFPAAPLLSPLTILDPRLPLALQLLPCVWKAVSMGLHVISPFMSFRTAWLLSSPKKGFPSPSCLRWYLALHSLICCTLHHTTWHYTLNVCFLSLPPGCSHHRSFLFSITIWALRAVPRTQKPLDKYL